MFFETFFDRIFENVLCRRVCVMYAYAEGLHTHTQALALWRHADALSLREVLLHGAFLQRLRRRSILFVNVEANFFSFRVERGGALPLGPSFCATRVPDHQRREGDFQRAISLLEVPEMVLLLANVRFSEERRSCTSVLETF